jgi:hypothetical protein
MRNRNAQYLVNKNTVLLYEILTNGDFSCGRSSSDKTLTRDVSEWSSIIEVLIFNSVSFDLSV